MLFVPNLKVAIFGKILPVGIRPAVKTHTNTLAVVKSCADQILPRTCSGIHWVLNAYLGEGGQAWGVRAGSAYVDVGTLYGYREAIRLLSGSEQRSELQEIKA